MSEHETDNAGKSFMVFGGNGVRSDRAPRYHEQGRNMLAKDDGLQTIRQALKQ